jgi:hypothetical protein
LGRSKSCKINAAKAVPAKVNERSK